MSKSEENSEINRGTLWAATALFGGLGVIGGGVILYRNYLERLSALSSNKMISGLYDAGLRLNTILVPDHSVIMQNFDTLASMPEQIRETLLSLEAIRTSITLNAHHYIDMLTRLDNWEVVVPLGLIIAVAATVGSSYINN